MMTNDVPQTVTPEQVEYIKSKLSDPYWRLTSGEIYKIIIKGEKSDDDLVIPFKPNRPQRRFIKRMHHRNLILKARQLGFTTLISIMWLDHAQYNPNSRCAIIAQDKPAAEMIFRDKVKFAYENQPAFILEMFPLKEENKSEIVFGHNNSSVRVATSARSGTTHRLHVSEFGKICAKFPLKAREVITGSIPSVPVSGIAIIESTAEGQEGSFYDMTMEALKLIDEKRELGLKDWLIHFFAWWHAPDYQMNPEGIFITDKDHAYFDKVEADMHTTITIYQRAWYVATRKADFAGSEEMMWQEYPSSPAEAFQQSTEGCYYAQQMTNMRKQGRILKIPKLDLPVFTFWDIGNSDGCAIWFMQIVGMEYRFIDYYEAHGETIAHYYKMLQDKNYIWGKHFFPHDAAHERLSNDNKSISEMFADKGLRNIEIVPRIENINDGIQQTREAMQEVYIDIESCELGIKRLDNYKKKWNERQGRWGNEPNHDINSEGADSFRGFAQAKALGLIKAAGQNKPKSRKSNNWRTA
jgi:hypothetical protein